LVDGSTRGVFGAAVGYGRYGAMEDNGEELSG